MENIKSILNANEHFIANITKVVYDPELDSTGDVVELIEMAEDKDMGWVWGFVFRSGEIVSNTDVFGRDAAWKNNMLARVQREIRNRCPFYFKDGDDLYTTDIFAGGVHIAEEIFKIKK